MYPDRRARSTVSAVMFSKEFASGQREKRSTAVRQYLKSSDVGSGPTMSMCRLWNRDVGRATSPSGVQVCLNTFDRWQDWHARAKARQSFFTPEHSIAAKRVLQ